MKTQFKLSAVAAVALGLSSAHALAADTLLDFVKQTTVSGNVRAYDFNRIFSDAANKAGQPSQSAFDIGGRFDAQTASFLGGFSLGAGFVTAHSLGFNDRDGATATSTAPPHLDATLAGSHNSLTALSQAYVQYKNKWVTIKAGDQNINTPWLSDSDSRLLPSTYQGVYADVTPLKNLHVIGMRIFRWKSRTSSDYYQTNLYYPTTSDGDDLQGGKGVKPALPDTQGTAAVGATYADHGLKVGLWYYNFEQFADMLYNDTVYTLKTGTGFDPFIGDQFARQWKSNSLLNGSAITVNSFSGNGVDNLTYGAKAGLNSPFGQLMLSYTNVEDHEGAVGHGALISPYTVGYTTDPMDTSSMIRGVVEQGPGHAWKARYQKKFLGDQIAVTTAFARYYADAYGKSNDAYFDIGYYPSGFMKGFSIRDRFEDAIVSNPTLGGGLNSGKSKYFIYNRVQLQYEF